MIAQKSHPMDSGKRKKKEQLMCNLQSDWHAIQCAFDNALLDVAEVSNDRQKTNIEQWYEIVKKVMKMWDSQTETTTEADDFYVFIYDD